MLRSISPVGGVRSLITAPQSTDNVDKSLRKHESSGTWCTQELPFPRPMSDFDLASREFWLFFQAFGCNYVGAAVCYTLALAKVLTLNALPTTSYSTIVHTLLCSVNSRRLNARFRLHYVMLNAIASPNIMPNQVHTN